MTVLGMAVTIKLFVKIEGLVTHIKIKITSNSFSQSLLHPKIQWQEGD